MSEVDQVTRCRSRGVIRRFRVPEADTLRAWFRRSIFRVSLLVGVVSTMGMGRASAQSGAGAAPADSFAHARHQKLPCMTCHLSSSGEMLTFQPPRGCQICHHTVQAKQGCVQCHAQGSVPQTIDVHVDIAAAGKPPLGRTVGFRHEWHQTLQCATCHGTPVTLAPVDSAQTCQGCHASHHEAGRSCATCHRTESINQPHMPPVQAHVACDRCHSTAAIAPLTPTRSFCLACHDPSVDHYPGRQCVACHLQSTPEEYRARLLK
jgi:hypothetical protein